MHESGGPSLFCQFKFVIIFSSIRWLCFARLPVGRRRITRPRRREFRCSQSSSSFRDSLSRSLSFIYFQSSFVYPAQEKFKARLCRRHFRRRAEVAPLSGSNKVIDWSCRLSIESIGFFTVDGSNGRSARVSLARKLLLLLLCAVVVVVFGVVALIIIAVIIM